MRVGVLLPHTGRGAGAASLRRVAAAAEELGYAGVWVGDHILLPAEQTSSYPYVADGDDDGYEVPADRPFMEAFTTLGFMAAVTERCTIGVSVTIVPYRHPALLAKQVGTLSRLSEGRLVLGVGAGWLREEFEALGSDFATRGARTDETLAFLRTAWATDGPVAFHGDHVAMNEPMHLNPGAGLTPAPPLWVGGNGPAALRRTAEHGDVWHPHIRGTTPEGVVRGLEEIRRRAAAFGRDLEPVAALHSPLVLTDGPGLDPSVAGRLEGPPSFIRETLQRYHDAGVAEIALSFGGGADRRVATMERLAEAVIA
jgi:probable F420-dependent oxidoreductase